MKRCSAPTSRPGQDIFELRGIDREQGCIVIVRPDQYVAHILPLDAHDALAGFFDGFMLPAAQSRIGSDGLPDP